jgi:hypothetical protein
VNRALLAVFLAIVSSVAWAQTAKPQDPGAPAAEAAAWKFLQLLDAGDEAAASNNLREGIVARLRLAPNPPPDLTQAAEMELKIYGGADEKMFVTRRSSGKLSNRQLMRLTVFPPSTTIDPATGKQAAPVRQFGVIFESDAANAGVTARRLPSSILQENLSGYLLPSGQAVITGYGSAMVVASTRAPAAAPAGNRPTGVGAYEAEAVEAALGFARLLDAGQIDAAMARYVAGTAAGRQAAGDRMAGSDARIRGDFERRIARGAMTNRRVLRVSGASDVRFRVEPGASANKPAVPPRYGLDATLSVETVSVNRMPDGRLNIESYQFAY